MAASSRTRYARAGDADIAYQVLGEGPTDILLLTGWTFSFDSVDDEPSLSRFHRRLASMGRLIRFDVRGVGLSDRGDPSDPPTQGQWAEDAIAVLDAAESERAVVIAPFLHTEAGLLLGAHHPDRVERLVIISGLARLMAATDYPFGFTEDFDQQAQVFSDPDAVELGYDAIALQGPSVAQDDVFRSWWDRAGNVGCGPAMANAIWMRWFAADCRHLLPEVRVPTLVLARSHSNRGESAGRYVADHIPGATFVAVPGSDAFFWIGDTAPILNEIEEFATGSRRGAPERVLTTVLFTDVVGSTRRATDMGDDRWRDLLDRHDRAVRMQIERFGGHEVNTVGDGFVATFASPSQAIACATSVIESMRLVDIEVRAGIHTGEVELRGSDIAGIGVHVGARVSALAGSGEVLVSSTVKEAVLGSPVRFAERGEHELKGVPGMWSLFAVESWRDDGIRSAEA